jgi:hypothetical protein
VPVYRSEICLVEVFVLCANSFRQSSYSFAGHHATILLSSPHSLAKVLASENLLGTSADIRLKHAALGFLKNLVQSSSRTAYTALYKAGIIPRICISGIWDEKADAMTDVVQLGAIGVVKHLCNGNGKTLFVTLLL